MDADIIEILIVVFIVINIFISAITRTWYALIGWGVAFAGWLGLITY